MNSLIGVVYMGYSTRKLTNACDEANMRNELAAMVFVQFYSWQSQEAFTILDYVEETSRLRHSQKELSPIIHRHGMLKNCFCCHGTLELRSLRNVAVWDYEYFQKQ